MHRVRSIVFICWILLCAIAQNAEASCTAPAQTKCAKIKLEKILGSAPKHWVMSEQSCRAKGTILYPTTLPIKVKQKVEFFMIGVCPPEGSELFGTLVWHNSCPDANTGLTKINLPALEVTPKDCTRRR